MRTPYHRYLVIAGMSLLLLACGSESGSSSGAQSSVATLSFENGETLSTSVICVLEPQTAAGQEILYTATSVRSPYFDVTVFAAGGIVSGAKVSWADTKDFKVYQERWSSVPGTAVSKASFDVALNGRTITGSGMLIRGDDTSNNSGEKRQSTLVVECGG
ncbi:MAG: hypothetical protein IMF06_15655 [Proteobacteria bacterium]|nr:hypothetical protein [Pseudomonadota bacterium]